MARQEAASGVESPPRRLGHWAGAAGYIGHLRHLAVAMEGHVAAGGQGPGGAVAQGTTERLHGEVVGQQQAVEADMVADDLLHASCRYRDGGPRIDRLEQDMAG